MAQRRSEVSTFRHHEVNSRRPDLEYVFYPRSIALVGASTDPNKEGAGFLKALVEFQFPGKVYPVNPKGGEMLGLKVYPSLREVPPPIDYVISLIPVSIVPQMMEDCVACGVKVVHFFTAGFSETWEEAGRRLEEEVVKIARKGAIRLIGPNCMGVYCPDSRISYQPSFPKESGSVAIVSQSGYNASDFIPMAAPRGIRFSKVISYGNACDLNECDFLEYCTSDPETKLIFSYIEGVKDGRRFLKALKESVKMKPVFILKGGRTEAGARAAASHTGSLAGTDVIWDALCKQFGAIRVHNLEELADLLVAFLYMKPPKGKNVGVIGTGGGPTVMAADDCEAAGLSVPLLPAETQQELGKFTPIAGNSTRNPIDSNVLANPEYFRQSIRIVADCPDIDFLICHLRVERGLESLEARRRITATVEAIIEAGKECVKPMAIVPRSSGAVESWSLASELQIKCIEAGFAVYTTVGRAARAISRLIQYHAERDGTSDSRENR